MNRKQLALEFATKAHEGQMRKLSDSPMIQHPIRVATTLENAGFSEDVIIAGYLHDTVEDTDVTFKEINELFGPDVVRIVKGNTEDKTKTWKQRKEHTIDTIKTAPLEIRALVVSDKLDNLKSMLHGYKLYGDSIWGNFKRGYEDQLWYFSSVCKNAFVGYKEIDLPEFFLEYRTLVEEFKTITKKH